MKDTITAKQLLVLCAGIAVGWLVMHLLVTNWEKIKTLAM